VIGGEMNPKPGFAVDTKLLKPVPRLVLNVVGAMPKPVNPDPKPPRNPFWNELPAKVGVKAIETGVFGKLNVGLGIVPTNGLNTPVMFVNAVLKMPGMAFAKSVLVVGSDCNAANRLVGVVPVPVIPVPVVPVPSVPVPLIVPKIAF